MGCSGCGAQSSSAGRFCSQCGARLSGSARPAEYKQVTVLFADVAGSLDIAAILDPERLREVITDLVEHCAAAARRYGGTIEYTGDGIMALFGAPTAVEDHAVRGCLTSIAIQQEANTVAAEVRHRDGIAIQVRVGLHSGQVIAGRTPTDSRYSATGETVGFAHRIESAAPPGAILLSETTARLVEHAVTLAEPEWVHIKGAVLPVLTRRLQTVNPRTAVPTRIEANLAGRRWEMAALGAALERAIGRRGGVVNVVGAPGIGKSRLAREAAVLAAGHGMDVFWMFCESHTHDIALHAVTRLLREITGITDLDGAAARKKVRQSAPDASPEDLRLLNDLLGITDPDMPAPQIDPHERRRQLTAMMNARAQKRRTAALFIIEDAHWIDALSDSLLADFLAVISQTMSMVLVTARPEYRGELLRVVGAQTIMLGPLTDSSIATVIGEMVGADPSVYQLTTAIGERAAGNPFFAEEMVRDMVQRGVLQGDRGSYVCRTDITEVSVPATVATAIDARIDRLSAPAKQTLRAASVIGTRFPHELLTALGINDALDELLDLELVEQVRFLPPTEYAFRHPLIHAVTYETQLRTERAQWHRRLAGAIEAREPQHDGNAALIAEHLQAAGELRAAHGWHMRAAAWSANRDLAAARVSWERAGQIADRLPGTDPDLLEMRIAPRTMLCATDWQARELQRSEARFAELRELCYAAGDQRSLAIAMAGPATAVMYAGRAREAAQLSSQQMALLESSGDPTLAMGLIAMTFVNWLGVGEFGDILRWSQRVVDLAAGDATKGAGFGVASPLAIASAWRGTARWWLGRPGWRADLHDAVALARTSNAETLSGTVAWSYGFAVQYGVLGATARVVDAGEAALRTALTASSDRAMGLATYTLAVALLHRDSAAERDRGAELMTQTRDIWLRKRAHFLIPVTDVWAARETARRGDRDAAIEALRHAVDRLRQAEHLFYGVWATRVLVEALLERGGEDDLAETRQAVDWLADLAAGRGSPALEITLLRLRTLLARADGDEADGDMANHYRSMAKTLGFEGHIAWSEDIADSGG